MEGLSGLEWTLLCGSRGCGGMSCGRALGKNMLTLESFMA